MEELGKIDTQGNGIDFGELFDENPIMKDGQKWYQWTQGARDAADKILGMAENNEDLAKGLESVIVNGTTIGEMLKKAKKGMEVNEADANAYHATLAAFYKAMQSGDWDLDSIYNSIKEILAGTGFEGEIKVGDMILTYK
jgi:hypothetical protein